jgi:hypothetical protein
VPTAQELNEALIDYIGYRTRTIPGGSCGDHEAEIADEVKEQVTVLLSDYSRFPPDWAPYSGDVKAAAAALRTQLSARHPWVDDEALDAVEWKFSWDWR